MPTSKDALMKELQGDSPLSGDPTITKVDEQTVDRTDPLALTPSSPRSAVAQADSVHALTKGAGPSKGSGYELSMKGTYYAMAADGRKKTAKEWALKVRVPELDGALAKVRRHLLGKMLPKKYPDYVNVRTAHIVSVQPLTADTPEPDNIQFVNRDKLLEVVAVRKIPINVHHPSYADTVVLRETVVDFLYNPNGFEKREATKQAKREEAAKMMSMNQDDEELQKPKETAADPLGLGEE